MSKPTPFPDLPKSGITFPNSPITAAAFAYTQQHTTEPVYNHCVRSAYWALILAHNLPAFAAADSDGRKPDLETVVLACVLHDMGWASTPGLRSKDRRFEVDGADIAKRWVREYVKEREHDHKHDHDHDGAAAKEGGGKWDAHRQDLIWSSIALHTTGSIALHAAPETALAHLGIMADFAGPLFPGGAISEAAYREVLGLFPLAGFDSAACKEILCGICRDKPATTFDNFVSEFGREFGLDGKGGGKEEFRREWEEALPSKKLLSGLDYLNELVKEGQGGKGE
ncbi:hypothetical protein F5B20DRAFT_294292 [Whalleya microplaca]|nr:hypothetical protein F5B20DRAFT_294292 [Whalleya microplaca]